MESIKKGFYLRRFLQISTFFVSININHAFMLHGKLHNCNCNFIWTALQLISPSICYWYLIIHICCIKPHHQIHITKYDFQFANSIRSAAKQDRQVASIWRKSSSSLLMLHFNSNATMEISSEWLREKLEIFQASFSVSFNYLHRNQFLLLLSVFAAFFTVAKTGARQKKNYKFFFEFFVILPHKNGNFFTHFQLSLFFLCVLLPLCTLHSCCKDSCRNPSKAAQAHWGSHSTKQFSSWYSLRSFLWFNFH